MKYFILVFLINVCVCDNFNKVQVEIKQGILSGKEEQTLFKKQKYYAFKGIPYAQPPTEELRFLPPRSHYGWQNVYEAYDNKPTCPQFSTRMRMDEPVGMSGSEDCLYISVFTPSIEGSAPVIVFDYNDNFFTGFNGTNTYSPQFFMEESIIVVTISHRFGILGYFTTEDDVIPANAGIKDFIMGLNWIKDNIKHFGGDPDRVTLMGSRGGAVLADILLRSDKAKNLFSGVILQSGTALETLFFKDDSRKRAFELGNALNITTNDSAKLLEEMQKLDIELMYRNEGSIQTENDEEDSQTGKFLFNPIVEIDHDDAVITALPENSKINDVPIMIGMNSREGLDLVSHYLFEPKILKDSNQPLLFLFPIRSGYRFNIKSDIYDEAISEILNYYFEVGYFYYGNLLEYVVYIGDMLQNYALNAAAKHLSKNIQSPVYYYVFDFRGELNENAAFISRYARFPLKPWGATITDELCYLHVCTRIENTYKTLLNLVSEPPEIKVMKKMVRLWANFARTRNPTPSNEDDVLKDFKWQPVSRDSNDANYLHITKTLSMKVNPLGEREKFWDEFMRKYSELVVNGVVQTNTTTAHEEL